MAENTIIDSYKHGKVNIADDVIGVISTIAASEIKGIKALNGTFQDDVLELIGKKNFNKGIQVEMNDNIILVELSVIVDYGTKIHEVAKEVQENVKLAIESMTGLEVAGVNVNIAGINIKNEKDNMK
ncbi:Asp23/Gls24 family envelope stress response protein [Fusibacter ferrireducens]|uniref:Asp23/Gls24 family envelope stress response protein n=1 Tax=Fusibacter ferrireducens TaxID=2785058 RepID=A0ABR9ZTA9_9FIRM|nr:Asp23/Gls24 family envelope stress response protein [Fusibacter ferrireducens]MBF4693687.1 Asp23/Gls24 family envelope stress response protein [Fusibacter ferrireducens]